MAAPTRRQLYVTCCRNECKAVTVIDYQFRPLGKNCAATGKPLAPGERCRSVLVEKSGELVRLDYSESAWPGPPTGSLGVWTSRVPASNQPKPIDANALMKLFEQTVEGGNLQQQRLAYVLALFLLQRRRLKLDGSRSEEGVDYLQLTGVQGEGCFEVIDQQLSAAEIAALRAEVTRQLTAEAESAA